MVTPFEDNDNESQKISTFCSKKVLISADTHKLFAMIPEIIRDKEISSNLLLA